MKFQFLLSMSAFVGFSILATSVLYGQDSTRPTEAKTLATSFGLIIDGKKHETYQSNKPGESELKLLASARLPSKIQEQFQTAHQTFQRWAQNEVQKQDNIFDQIFRLRNEIVGLVKEAPKGFELDCNDVMDRWSNRDISKNTLDLNLAVITKGMKGSSTVGWTIDFSNSEPKSFYSSGRLSSGNTAAWDARRALYSFRSWLRKEKASIQAKISDFNKLQDTLKDLGPLKITRPCGSP